MKKKGFSLIELIIVMAIIAVLMVTLKNIFNVKNKDTFYGQTCANSIYGSIVNFLNAGVTSKGLGSGNTIIYPDKYNINFDVSGNQVSLKYYSGTDIFLYQNFDLNGSNIPSNFYCKGNSYYMKLSGSSMDVLINKGLKPDSDLRTFIISGSVENQFTGNVGVFQCDSLTGGTCKEMSDYIIDDRAQNIYNKSCLSYGTGTDCIAWN